MKKLSAALPGVMILSTALSSAATPAFALGDCGPNRHRNAWGHCVCGGQKLSLVPETYGPSSRSSSRWDDALF